MNRTLKAVSLAALSATLFACSDATPPISQAQADETLATLISGATVDPNAVTEGGHTATTPKVSCTYDATTKWTTCGPTTQNGMTVTRQVQFLDGKGNAQQRPDTATRSMKSKTTVTGTITMKNGSTKVNRTSEETVTGLGPASTQRVVNGTASGTEDSKVTDTRGTMTMSRQYADTTKNLTFSSSMTPLSPWPTAGSVVRQMKSTAKLNDGTPKDYASREERTYEAGGKVTIKTTINGQTRTCVVVMGTTAKPTCS